MYRFILVEIVEVGLFETSSSKVTGIVWNCDVVHVRYSRREGQKDCEGVVAGNDIPV